MKRFTAAMIALGLLVTTCTAQAIKAPAAAGAPAAPEPARKKSIYKHFGIEQIVSITFAEAPANSDFSADDAASVTKTDPKLIAELTALLKALPASGTLHADFGTNVPRQRLELQTKGGKKHSLMFYNRGVQLPDGSFYGAEDGAAARPAKKLSALIQTKLNPRKIDTQVPGTYTWGKWAYTYRISHRGSKSEKRWGRLTYGGKDIAGAAESDRIITPWGMMQQAGTIEKPRYDSGWLWKFTYDRPIDRTRGRLLLTGQAPHRVKLLKKHIEKFVLVVRYYGPQDKRYYSLTLRVPVVKDQRLPFWPAAQLSKAQAEKIINHLDAAGILAAAGNLANKNFEPPKGPTYALLVSGPPNLQLHEPLGWDLKMLGRLVALRRVLDGEAGKEMDRLLKALDSQGKKWQKPAGGKPAAKPAVKWGKPVGGLACGISAFKKSVQLGIPYEIEVSIKNISKGDILLFKRWLGGGYDRVILARAGKQYREYYTIDSKAMEFAAVSARDLVRLKPKEIYKFTHKTVIASEYKHRRPSLGFIGAVAEGTYQMRVRYEPRERRVAKGVDLGGLKPWKGVLLSAPVEIVVGKAAPGRKAS